MTLRNGPSGPVITPQFLFARGTAATLVNLGRLAIVEFGSSGGLSVVSNRIQVTEPGWYELSGLVSATVEDAFDAVFAARLSTLEQQTESQIPFNGTDHGIGCAPVENLFQITDPTTQLVEVVNISGVNLTIQGASLTLKKIG